MFISNAILFLTFQSHFNFYFALQYQQQHPSQNNHHMYPTKHSSRQLFIERSFIGIDRLYATVNGVKCRHDCNPKETLLLHRVNRTFECVKHEEYPKRFGRCLVKLISDNPNDTTFDIPTVKLNMDEPMAVKVMHVGGQRKALFSFQPSRCEHRQNCVYVQSTNGSNSIWKCLDFATTCLKFEKKNKTVIFKTQCTESKSRLLSGQLLMFDIHCVYQFGTVIKSVNTCLMLKIMGKREVPSRSIKVFCRGKNPMTPTNKMNLETNSENASINDNDNKIIIAVTIGILVTIVILCIVVAFLYHKFKRKTENCFLRSKKEPVNSSESEGKANANVDNGETALYEEIEIKSNEGKDDQLKYESLLRKDEEYLLPIDGVNNSLNQNLQTQEEGNKVEECEPNEERHSKNFQSEKKLPEGYEKLYASHYQQYEPYYEIMDPRNRIPIQR